MSGFDIIVWLVVGAAALGGLSRGFVQEILSLCAWLVAIIAIRLFHNDLSLALTGETFSETSAAILAFVILLFVPYGAVRMLATKLGKKSRQSVLGPVDRVLGLGFGAVKGIMLVVVGFSLLVLGYDMVWGEAGRPLWLREARSYQFVDAASRALVEIIAERREELREAVTG